MPGHTNRVIYFDHNNPVNSGITARHGIITKRPIEWLASHPDTNPSQVVYMCENSSSSSQAPLTHYAESPPPENTQPCRRMLTDAVLFR